MQMERKLTATSQRRSVPPSVPPVRQERSRLLFERGYADGYDHGVREGLRTFGAGLEGTSIIIPTYNRKALLLECLDSIEAHTSLPYEIIVVDNGSEDGTAEEVRRRRGRIRLTVHPRNLGFARAINSGLMMAKGHTIVLLNNDVLVTERWLDQLLNCLRGFPDAAAAGPVTNYISGEQLIDVPYENVAEMPAFAAAHNAADPRKWRMTDRLVGFCVAFPRSTFEQIGYFDEGYEIGNYEDDDWVARLRLQGKRMVIAGDTFVHHYGSMTMKGLGQQGFTDVNARNHDFFREKWGELQGLYPRSAGWRTGGALRSADFFPTHVLVKGWSSTVYWLEQGIRHPVSPDAGQAGSDTGATGFPLPATRLSVLDLLQLPQGPVRSQGGLPVRPGSGLTDGAVVRGSDGRLYQIDRGLRREIVSEYALGTWGLAASEEAVPEGVLSAYPEGLPILPPPRLLNDDL
ncbi:glycosyltransferase family 2 protein [Paenibacillus macerans]|uniref:glycosyltransferase family 2 protein n=1 Tax=Paenibacillus macerans TaxID=44252 RepID=UPI003D31B04D